MVPREWCIVRRVLDGRRFVLLPEGGLTLHTFGYAENLAHAVLLAVDRPDAAAGQAYNCGDEQVLTLRQVVQHVAACMGATLEILSLPAEVGAAGAADARPRVRRHHRVLDLSIAAPRARLPRRRRARGGDCAAPSRGSARPPAGGTAARRSSILQDPFDYAAEDALVAAGAARSPACRPSSGSARRATPRRTAGPAGRRARASSSEWARAAGALAVALAGCAWFPPLPTPRLRPGRATHTIASDQVTEASGLALSHRSPSHLWTHNDSGDRARLFLLDMKGALVAEYAVDGAKAVDWEDIASDGAGHLYVGDIGNNRSSRRDLRVYRVREPDPREPGRRLHVERTLRFPLRRPGRTPRPGPGVRRRGPLLRRPRPLDLDEAPARHGHDPLPPRGRRAPGRAGARASAAARPPHRERAVRDGHWRRSIGGRQARRGAALHGHLRVSSGAPTERSSRSRARIALDPLRTGQVEGITWDGQSLLFCNEAGDLFRIPSPLDPALDRYPPP